MSDNAKTIYILRHGKAEEDRNHDDFRRALTAGGEKDVRDSALALLSAARLARLPGAIVASSAARAKQTAKIAAAFTGISEKKCVYRQEFYEGRAGDWLAHLRKLPEKTSAVLLVGHNPVLEVLARKLGGGEIDLPPGGLLALQFSGAWKSVGDGDGGDCALVGAHYAERYEKRLPPIDNNIFADGAPPVTPQNRELSWLSFNARIAQEAADKTNNPVERLAFTGIVSSNLDEFYRVRMGSVAAELQRGKKSGGQKSAQTNTPMRELSQAVRRRVQSMQANLTQLMEAAQQDLADEHGILFVNEKTATPQQRKDAKLLFENDLRGGLFAVMQPDAKTLNSYLRSDAIYLALRLRNAGGKKRYALAEIAGRNGVGRFVPLPVFGKDGAQHLRYMWLDDVLRLCLPDYFRLFGYETESAHCLKITRSADTEEDAGDKHQTPEERIIKMLKMRDTGKIVRFIHDAEMPADVAAYFQRRLDFAPGANTFPGGRYHNHRDFIGFRPPIRADIASFVKPLPVAELSAGANYFAAAEKKDILLHFPHHGFRHIVNLLREASLSPEVTHIDITLYRVAKNSELVDALVNARYNGKAVRVMMELKARFNEEDNLRWRRILTERGITVLPQIGKKKVHAKICLIRRAKRPDIAVFSTGNFNEKTAKLYSDAALITANKELAADALQFFAMLEKPEDGKLAEKLTHLLASPHTMRRRLVELATREMENAAAGKKAAIYLKLNNFNDASMTHLLHRAAMGGVQVNIIARSTFSLNPELPEYEGRLRAVSIVDSLLEHARVFVFANSGGGAPLVYLSSADFLPRNLDRRFEVAAPVLDKKLQRQLIAMLDLQLSDNVKARLLNAAQDNQRQQLPGAKVRAQKALAKLLTQ